MLKEVQHLVKFIEPMWQVLCVSQQVAKAMCQQSKRVKNE